MISHFGFDTLPRIVPSTVPGLIDVVLPFRVDGAYPADVISWTLHAEVGGRRRTTRGRVITRGFIAGLRRQMQQAGMFDFERLPPYLDMEAQVDSAVYIEARVPRLNRGELVTYHLEVTLENLPTAEWSTEFKIYAVRPAFNRADIRRVFAADVMRPQDAWVLYHRQEEGFHYIRIDVASLKDEHVIASGGTAGGLVDLVVTAAGRLFDLNQRDFEVLPLVDPAADSVVFTIPAAEPLGEVTVRYHDIETVEVDVTSTDAGEARVMFVNFAIQGLNDYFATPDSRYSPPRTYTQVTMRDESATFSSRPGSPEDSIGDGYAFTLQAHRRYRIKQMWAMNGGLAMLLAHDSPKDLALLRQDITNGLVVPVVAGFGAHRLPYYSAATNVEAIRDGMAVLNGILGADSAVYYPDSRIYADCPQVIQAFTETDLDYIVVDADNPFEYGNDVLHNTVVSDPKPEMNKIDGKDRWVDFLNVWRDRKTRVKLLFIDPQMKDRLFGADDAAAERGKLPLDLREKFIAMAAQPQLRANNLLVYSDDADKASGDGWFDGNATPMNRNYQAALSWISKHPWVQAVTTAGLVDDDCVGDLDLHRASDPYIEREWRMDDITPLPGYRFGLAFDAWYAKWAPTRVVWLDETLADITRRAENAIAGWPVRNRLVDLARLYFTMCLHESQWSKITRGAGRDPEDFVVAESIQLRNAHVFLAAGVWADWAASEDASEEAYRDRGPVVDRVAQLEIALGTAPPWRLAGGAGLQWDHDPLPCIVLYNTDALVVIDRNGGRITHAFIKIDGSPYCISGTFKAYQFLDVDWPSGAGSECDGIVLQNTVYTPNHAYVACDIEASVGTFGDAPPGDSDFDWIYPDNFNAYSVVATGDGPSPSVTLEYGAGTSDPPPTTLDELQALLERDRERKLADGPDAGVIFHDTARFGTFRKTIQLDGDAVRVRYTDVTQGHLVANEFCVDLWSAALRGTTQTRSIAADRRSITLTNGTPAVEVTLGSGCVFSKATLAPLIPPTSETLRLHRVMTDTLEIVAPEGGDFDFTIVLRSSTAAGDSSDGS